MSAEKPVADTAEEICFISDRQVKIEKALARERVRAENAERERDEMFADLTARSGPRARAQMRIDQAAWPTQTSEQRFDAMLNYARIRLDESGRLECDGKTIAKERAASVVATLELAMTWKANAAELADLKAAAGQCKPTPGEIVAKIALAGLDGNHLDRFEHALERDRLIHEVEVAALRGVLRANLADAINGIDALDPVVFEKDWISEDPALACKVVDGSLAQIISRSVAGLTRAAPSESIKQVVEVLRKMSAAHSPDCSVAVNVRHGCTCHVELRADALRLLGVTR